MVIRRLLEHFSRAEVVLIGRPAHARRAFAPVPSNYDVLTIPAPSTGLRGEMYWMMLAVIPGVITGLLAVRKHRPTVIVGFFPDEGSLLTSYVLSRITGLPLVSYLCDLYVEERQSGWRAKLAVWLQARVFHHSASVISLTEGMAQFLKDKYDLPPTVVPHCVNGPVTSARTPNSHECFVIGYCGSINDARIAPLRAVTQIVGERTDYELRYFGSASQSFLETNGLWNGNTRVSFAPSEDDLIKELACCDALFLPLSGEADSNSKEQIATSFPTKALDYFKAGRPVVVQSGESDFVTRFFRERNCGVVVTRNEKTALLQGFERIRNNPAVAQQLAENGTRAAVEFSGSAVATQFRRILQRAHEKKGKLAVLERAV